MKLRSLTSHTADAKERFPGNVKEQQRFYDDWNQESFRNVSLPHC